MISFDSMSKWTIRPMEAASHALGSDTMLRLVGRSSLAGFGSRVDLMQPGLIGQVMWMRREHGPDWSDGHDVTEKALFGRTAKNGRRDPRHACIHQIGKSSPGVAAGSGPECAH